MGTLFMYQGLYDEVIRVNRKAIDAYLALGKRNNISYSQRDIARIYNIKNMQDSALYYYKKTCQTALESGDSSLYYGILGELGGYYESQERNDSAKLLLKVAESKPFIQFKDYIYHVRMSI